MKLGMVSAECREKGGGIVDPRVLVCGRHRPAKMPSGSASNKVTMPSRKLFGQVRPINSVTVSVGL